MMINCDEISARLMIIKAHQKAFLKLIKNNDLQAIRIFSFENYLYISFFVKVELFDKKGKSIDSKYFEYYCKLNDYTNEPFHLNLTNHDLENFLTVLKNMNCSIPLRLRMFGNNASEWSQQKLIKSQTWTFYQTKHDETHCFSEKTLSITTTWFGAIEHDEMLYPIKVHNQTWQSNFALHKNNSDQYEALILKDDKKPLLEASLESVPELSQ